MFKILMPVDFSESALNAFAYAAQMTQALHARLMLLHVVEPIGGDATMFVDEGMIEDEMQEAREKLDQLVREKLPNIDPGLVDIEVVTGFVVNKIEEMVASKEVSLVVMGTKGSNNKLKDIFGSNTYKIVKHAECAVLTVPQKASKFSINKIALAVGLHEKENIHLLTVLKHLARHFRAEVILLHIKKDKDVSMDDDVSPDAVLWLSEQLKDLNKTYVNISSEDVANSINEYAIKNGIDLLAMSPGKHSFLYQLVEGSTTRKLVLHSDTPLLTLPADY
ncbi:UspA [Fulvivirga imtechensis AK7]|uniref:UspA n=1 Tax=Fulvivirga imtechensis AK7 TaxID=1237149 RepID=L8JXV2_9BACT|nr:universal stress protein [Fulvivirga imtechensis]ELR73886.1 UspA [Fulvivirga imtechensis AK7]